MRKGVYLTLLLFIFQCATLPIHAKALDYNFEELMRIYEEQSIISDKVILEHLLTRAAYEEYLDEYSFLEDGVEQLSEVMTVLHMMIDQTIEKANHAGPHDREMVITTLGELEKMSGEDSNLDQSEVEVVEVIYDQEDILDLIPDDIVDQIPDEIKDQLPDEGSIDVPDIFKGIKVKVAIDSQAYYMKLVLPELMNQLGEAKTTYNQLVKDQQLDIYVEMESLKVLTDNLKHIEEQASLQERHDFEVLVYTYSLNLQQLEIVQQEYTLLESEYKDEQEKNSLGLATLTEVSEKQNKVIVLNEEKTKLENEIEKQYNTIIYGLKLDPTESYTFTVTIQDIDVNDPLAYEEFAGIVKSQSMDLLKINRQIRLYDDLQALAEQVYRQHEEELQIITLIHAMKDIEYNKLLDVFDVLIRNTYNNYRGACEAFNISKEMMAVADEEYAKELEKYQIGLISDREYEKANITYNQEKFAYQQAIVAYNEALHTYIEALNGTVDTSLLQAN